MKKILGMPLALVLIGMLVIGGATAALVGYLSNEVTADVTVESPIILSTSATWDYNNFNDANLELGNLYATDSFNFFIKEEILGEGPIDSTLRIIVTNTLGIDSCSEIESLIVKGKEGSSKDEEIVGLCVKSDNRLLFDVPSNNMYQGVIYYEVIGSFGKYASGTYTATIQHI